MRDSTNTSSVLSPAGFLKSLTAWQRAEISGLPKEGIKCLINHWYNLTRFPILGSYCNATWDDIYCWPPTLAGHNVSRPCSEVMKNDPDIPNPEDVEGDAFRICKADGTWEWEGWTNYNECVEALVDYPTVATTPGPDMYLVNTVRYVLFIGSVLSFLSLLASLSIFYYFKSLRCDRITVQIHLMLALALRFLFLIIISEPFVFQRSNHYRTVDWICKVVMATQLYGTVASVSWMFVQGHYLHSRVTTNVFDRGTPFKSYFVIGWGIPLMLILFWTLVMEIFHPIHCWKSYGEQHYIWIILGPMIAALSVNLLFLINIMRILLTKIQLASISSDSTQFRRAVKATALLFPLLGVNNLLFLYNPGGSYEAAYMITNTVFQSSQGIMVSILYCFLSKEVRDAIRREYRRFTAKRTTHSRSTRRSKISRRSSYWNQTGATNSILGEAPSTVPVARKTFSSRAASQLKRKKIIHHPPPAPAEDVNSSLCMKNNIIQEEEEEEYPSTDFRDVVEFSKPYVTVAYCCHRKEGCKLIGESIPDVKSVSDDESSEAALQILSQGYGQAFPNFDNPVVEENNFPGIKCKKINPGCNNNNKEADKLFSETDQLPQFL